METSPGEPVRRPYFHDRGFPHSAFVPFNGAPDHLQYGMVKILSLLAAGILLAGTVGVASSGAAGQGPDAGIHRAADSPASGGAPWDWPLSPKPAVERPFDPPPKPWMSGHRGVDLRTPSAGVPVLAPGSGTVSFVGIVVDRPVVTIDHGNGLKSSFEPVTSTLEAGAPVAQGQLIGTLETGHCGPAACLHWGVRQGDVYLNPLSFVMDLRPSVLLPLYSIALDSRTRQSRRSR